MRVKLFEEGITYPNGMFLSVGAIQLPVDETIALYKRNNEGEFGPGDVTGFVTNIERVDNTIYGDLSVEVDTEFYDFSAYCTHVEIDTTTSIKRVESAKLRAIQVIPIKYKSRSLNA